MAPHSTASSGSPYSSSYSSSSPATSTSSVDSLPGTLALPTRPLTAGVYVPTPCFFHANEDIDTATISSHAVRLARAGVAGLTTQGSNGEAVHLTHSERALVTRTTRRALDDAGYTHLPVIVGCGAQSTRETIELCEQAADAGGDYVLLLPPSYYKAAMSARALREYFEAVADASPLPLMLYNYPGAAAGTDLDSDFLLQIAAHPNVVGVKLTCGNVGKLGRVASATAALRPSDPQPKPVPTLKGSASSSSSSSSASASASASATAGAEAAPPSPADGSAAAAKQKFLVLAGSADFFLPALSVNGSGTLAGLANICPRTHVAMLDAYRAGDLRRAQALQEVLGRADLAVQKGGVVGTKEALKAEFGYGGFARRPLPRGGKVQVRENWESLREVMEVERGL